MRKIVKLVLIILVYIVLMILFLNMVTGGKPLPKMPGEQEMEMIENGNTTLQTDARRNRAEVYG